MSRRIWIGVAVLAAGAALWALQRDPPRPEDEWQRPGFAVPRPTRAEKVRHFYELFTSPGQLVVGDQTIPIWQKIAEPALSALLPETLDFLLAEERADGYRAAPYTLANVLRLLGSWPDAAGHPRTVPFLLYWLDPAHCPPDTPGNRWAADFRRQVFQAFAVAPRGEYASACIQELVRSRRVHDLRMLAIRLLLQSGRGVDLLPLLDRLPPNEEEPDLNLRLFFLVELNRTLGGGQSAAQEDAMRAFLPFLRRSLESEDPTERVNAAIALGRLGEAGMERALIAEFEKNDGGRERRFAAAWTAIEHLARDYRHAYARRICLERGADPEQSEEAVSALMTLAFVWAEDADVQALLWKQIRGARIPEIGLNLLRRLLRVDRPAVVAYLREEIESDDPKRLRQAMRFAGAEPVRETGPWLLERARRASGETDRVPIYTVLTQVREPGVVPLLIGELREGAPDVLRNAAASNLITLGQPEGLTAVAEAIRRGDPVVLRLMVYLATEGGAVGVPDPLVAPLLELVRSASSESARLSALHAIRCRGRADGVTKPLLAAYEREPSRRVAAAIRDVVIELAHR